MPERGSNPYPQLVPAVWGGVVRRLAYSCRRGQDTGRPALPRRELLLFFARLRTSRQHLNQGARAHSAALSRRYLLRRHLPPQRELSGGCGAGGCAWPGAARDGWSGFEVRSGRRAVRRCAETWRWADRARLRSAPARCTVDRTPRRAVAVGPLRDPPLRNITGRPSEPCQSVRIDPCNLIGASCTGSGGGVGSMQLLVRRAVGRRIDGESKNSRRRNGRSMGDATPAKGSYPKEETSKWSETSPTRIVAGNTRSR